MEQQHIGFIGGGNMARAMIKGLLSNQYSPEKITVSNPPSQKLDYFRDELKIGAISDNKELVERCDIIVFAVKPHVLIPVAKEVEPVVEKCQPFIISITAGIPCEQLQNIFGDTVKLCRAMPNLPAMVRTAATALFATSAVTPLQREMAEEIMRAVGLVVWVDVENQLDIVTALSGSGPAYFLFMMEAMIDAAKEIGLDGDLATLLTKQTILGTAHIVMETEASINLLLQHVTSPGGTTEAGLAELTANNAKQTVQNAVRKAYRQAQKLSKIER